MKSELFTAVCEMLPHVVTELYNWNHPDGEKKEYALELRRYSRSTGCEVGGRDQFVIGLDELLSHVKQAKKLSDATIQVGSAAIIAKRERPECEKIIIATYRPLAVAT